MDISSFPMFLTAEEVVTLTGRKIKSKQIAALKAMKIPFRVNASGRPVVTRLAIEGGIGRESMPKQKWQPAI